MKNNKLKVNKIYFTWAFLILIFVVALFIIASFVGSIISAYVLAFLFLPIFKKFNKKMGKSLSAFLCIILLLIIVIVPLFLVVNQIISETSTIIKTINISSMDFSSSFGILNVEDIKNQAISSLSSWIWNIVSSLPSVLVGLLVTFFGMFYFLYDWDSINSFLYRKIPLEDKKELFEDVSKTTKRITYGLLLVGALEFFIALVGFSISGVKFSLLLSLIIGLFAFTLVLDASIIWGPLALIYLLVLDNPGTALGVLITGIILSTDTLFRPKIIGSVSKINPFVMLLGVLGGIAIFGILGFIIGPIVLFFALRLLKESFEIDGENSD